MARPKRKQNQKPMRVATAGLSGNVDTQGATTSLSGSASVPADRLRPWWLAGTCALFVARPLFPSESPAAMGDDLPVVMLWIVLAVVWLLGVIGRPKFAIRFGWTDAAVIIFIVLHSLAGVYAAIHGSPRPAINVVWQYVGLGLAFLLARQFIQNGREARAVVAVMIGLAVALSGYGLYQYFYELPQTRAAYIRDADQALREAGMWYEPGSPERQVFEQRLASTEPLATFALTNSLAGYLAPWLIVAAGVVLSPLGIRTRLALGCLCLPIAAYAAAVLGLVLVWLVRWNLRSWSRWKLPLAVVVAAGLLLGTAVAVGGLDVQIVSEAAKSFTYRVEYWQATLGMIADRPLVGCGPGNFQHAYTAYKLPQASEEVADPHNFLLEIWATAGTLTMLAFLAVLGCFAWTLWGAKKGSDLSPPQHRVPPEGCSGLCDKTETAPFSPGVPLCVVAGGGCGFLLAWPLGLMGAAPPGIAVLALGLPLAAGSVALLADWIKHGRLPAALPAIGLIVLLVNLLAAGGIGFAGVAGTLWLLLALGLNAVETGLPRILSRRAGFAALLAAIALAVACYSTAYGPVLRCRAELHQAQQDPIHAVEHLQKAATADRLAAEPWHQLASIAFDQWQETPTADALATFETCNAKALQLAANSSPAWLNSGDCYSEIYRKTRRPVDIRKAVDAYRRAVRLYPNSGVYRAKLALALDAAGDRSGFRREAAAALELDERTPHADKKLPPELRRQLIRSTSSP